MPYAVETLWRDLRADLRSLNAGFEIWIDWYQNRLDGKMLNLELEKKCAVLPDEILKREPAEINAYLSELQEDHLSAPKTETAQVALPDIPEEQEPGLQFALGPDGKLDLKPSGLASPNDLAEIAEMREVLTETLNDLIALLEGSNAFHTISDAAKRYKLAIIDPELSIDLLYCYGVRLENASASLKKEIKTGDYPDLSAPTSEALDSIIALHGPMMASTARGQILMKRARDFAKKQADVEALKDKGRQLAAGVQEALAKPAREALERANEAIGEGPHPDRATEIARTTYSNFLIAAAKALIAGIKADLREGVRMTVKLAVHAALSTAFYAIMPLLREYAAIAGFEIRWLPAFLDWLEAHRARRSDQK